MESPVSATTVQCKEISQLRVRSNPRMRFIRFDEMVEEERTYLAPLLSSNRYLGVLKEARDDRTMKSASASTVELLDTLRGERSAEEAMPLLRSGTGMFTLANLILDGLVELSDGTQFVTGAEAFHLLVDDIQAPQVEGALSKLTLDAIDLCAHLPIRDPITLSWKLYQYNRLPVTPRMLAQWPDGRSVARFLSGAGARQSKLEAKYNFDAGTERFGWLTWANRKRSKKPGTCKLYVSPAPEDVAEAFAQVARTALVTDVSAFKIGMNAHGLMRPDKLVVYFEDPTQLRSFFEQTRSAMSAIRAHGVPFTTQLDQAGLFSQGQDPSSVGHLAWHSDDSWRIWICNRLASAIVEARLVGFSECKTASYALARLMLLGVNVSNWTLVSEQSQMVTGLEGA